MGKQKKKRKTVPAALHSEISEYAALIRVLRVSDTLDIATHLTRVDTPHPSWQATSGIKRETGWLEASTSSQADYNGVSSPSIEFQGHPSTGDASVPPGTSRNTWTRWPLLAGDIHIPEWGFEDEVHSLAKQVLAFGTSNLNYLPVLTSSQFHGIDPSTLNEDPVEVLLPPSSLRALSDVSSSHLEHILSALASYCPSVEKSAHDRHYPIGWDDVLDIVGATGLFDGNVIRNVKVRLEAIYGPHLDSSDVITNLPHSSTTATFQDLVNADFFDDRNLRNRQKPGRYKKSSRKPSITLLHQHTGPSSTADEV
ncbi:hypothetical protein B0F90DRAFT_1818190 [Multifurca ochricompacta]|uniref:Uncharacterized protein n=1 Tax=Multifurca ochricompacta TaxID=376703 RepID=A0AAD4QK97_9AGAM|nr:hypothetical protein B0F90DRAFT_1818190 [Multifurca ochricompacta]